MNKIKKTLQHIRDFSYLKNFDSTNYSKDYSRKNLFTISFLLLQAVFFLFFGFFAFGNYLEFIKNNRLIIIIFLVAFCFYFSLKIVELIIAKTENPVGRNFSKKEIRFKGFIYYSICFFLFSLTIVITFIFTYFKFGHF